MRLFLREYSLTFNHNSFGCLIRCPIFVAYRVLKVMASFLSPTAFALGSINFADYERAQVGLRWSNIWRVSLLLFFHLLYHQLQENSLPILPQDSSGVCFLVCLVMMVVDTFLYGAVGLCLDKV